MQQQRMRIAIIVTFKKNTATFIVHKYKVLVQTDWQCIVFVYCFLHTGVWMWFALEVVHSLHAYWACSTALHLATS